MRLTHIHFILTNPQGNDQETLNQFLDEQLAQYSPAELEAAGRAYIESDTEQRVWVKEYDAIHHTLFAAAREWLADHGYLNRREHGFPVGCPPFSKTMVGVA